MEDKLDKKDKKEKQICDFNIKKKSSGDDKQIIATTVGLI